MCWTNLSLNEKNVYVIFDVNLILFVFMDFLKDFCIFLIQPLVNSKASGIWLLIIIIWTLPSILFYMNRPLKINKLIKIFQKVHSK